MRESSSRLACRPGDDHLGPPLRLPGGRRQEQAHWFASDKAPAHSGAKRRCVLAGGVFKFNLDLRSAFVDRLGGYLDLAAKRDIFHDAAAEYGDFLPGEDVCWTIQQRRDRRLRQHLNRFRFHASLGITAANANVEFHWLALWLVWPRANKGRRSRKNQRQHGLHSFRRYAASAGG